MKKILVLIPILVISLALSLNFRNFNSSKISELFSYSICDKPIYYRIDTVDPKFNLDREEFSSDINQAVQIWNKTIGKNLFIYDPKGDLSINLIYDERQTLTNQISQLENNLDSDKQSLNPKVIEYEKQSQEFKQKVGNLNKKIDEWNSKGGAPPEEYKKIIQEQQDLQSEANRLNTVAQSLNISTKEYNSEVNRLNQTITTLNNALTERPEEGIFKGPENRIEIYFNISQTELIHTLAHELGHALGLLHSNNPKAIMYFRTNQIIVPTEDDKIALEDICRQHTIFEDINSFVSEIIVKYKSFKVNI